MLHLLYYYLLFNAQKLKLFILGGTGTADLFVQPYQLRLFSFAREKLNTFIYFDPSCFLNSCHEANIVSELLTMLNGTIICRSCSCLKGKWDSSPTNTSLVIFGKITHEKQTEKQNQRSKNNMNTRSTESMKHIPTAIIHTHTHTHTHMT